MGILLTDEEIRVAKAEAVRLSWTHKTHPSYEKDKFLLEAQLKKVVEWQLAPCKVLSHEGFNGLQGNCCQCWQALLQEIE